MLPFISYLTGKVHPTLCPQWTPLKHLTPGQELYPWPRSFSSPAARQIHGHCLLCPWPPQFVFPSWRQAFSHISISNAKATLFHQSHFCVTQEGMRPPQRRGICRALLPPLTCLPWSCQESSFKPRHEADSSCPRISAQCSRYFLGVRKALLHSIPSWEIWFCFFPYILPESFHQALSPHKFWSQILSSAWAICLPVFRPSWVFWTSSLAFQLRLCLPASLNPLHVDLGCKIWLCHLLTEHPF